MIFSSLKEMFPGLIKDNGQKRKRPRSHIMVAMVPIDEEDKKKKKKNPFLA